MVSLSKNARGIVQSDIRTMSVECEKVGGINLAQGVCDTGVPLPVRRVTTPPASKAASASRTRLRETPSISCRTRSVARRCPGLWPDRLM